MYCVRAFLALQKSPKKSASRISVLQSEMDPTHPDGFSGLRLKSEPVDRAHRDGSSNVSENAEGIFSEHCGGSKSQSIGLGTSGTLAIEGSGFLSISDRALLRRFGSLETPRKDLRRVEESRLEVTTNVSRVDETLNEFIGSCTPAEVS